MKKKLVMFLTMLAAVVATHADNTLSATGSIAKANGSKGILSVSMTNDVAIKGVEFTLNLPAGITITDYYTTSRSEGFLVSYTANDGKVTLNTNDATIAAGEGDIVNFTIKASQELTVGTVSGTLTDIVLAKSGTDDVGIDEISYNIEITDGVTLYDTSTALPATQGHVDVTVERTIKADVWNTICLPFDMSEAQLKAAFGNDVQFCEIQSLDQNGNSFTINFESLDLSGGLEKNTPYLIKVSSEILNFTVSNVSIEADENDANIPVSSKRCRFIGTLRAQTIPADNLYISNNMFYYSPAEDLATIKAFRGYFYLRDFSSAAGAPQLNLSIDGETTGIYVPNMEGNAFTIEDGKIYDLKGMQVDNPQKGIYIQNGKKIVIK